MITKGEGGGESGYDFFPFQKPFLHGTNERKKGEIVPKSEIIFRGFSSSFEITLLNASRTVDFSLLRRGTAQANLV